MKLLVDGSMDWMFCTYAPMSTSSPASGTDSARNSGAESEGEGVGLAGRAGMAIASSAATNSSPARTATRVVRLADGIAVPSMTPIVPQGGHRTPDGRSTPLMRTVDRFRIQRLRGATNGTAREAHPNPDLAAPRGQHLSPSARACAKVDT